jgi:hypothetical protein
LSYDRSSGPAGTVYLMAVPLDVGAPDRRRVGPFWIEEGPGALLGGAAIVVLFAALFILAVAMRPA